LPSRYRAGNNFCPKRKVNIIGFTFKSRHVFAVYLNRKAMRFQAALRNTFCKMKTWQDLAPLQKDYRLPIFGKTKGVLSLYFLYSCPNLFSSSFSSMNL
jgi:hypothetical protein